MKTTLSLLTLTLILTGCLNPNLCGTENRITKNDALSSEHLTYFEDRPTGSAAESYGTLLPFIHVSEHLQKEKIGYRYNVYVSILGGLLLEGSLERDFDQQGQPLENDKLNNLSCSLLSGLLFEVEAFDWNKTEETGAVRSTVLLKSLGASKTYSGSTYLTILWMPIHISDNN